ncbi:acyl carrier protein [Bythopirellula polymerisocia]|uniref:Acyl carrier protein n=1 Tax=Bythopirellula polymerisocia TaxID=2528003 RepID=A0A5C6CS83_9BACT|nr:acyl carrier protein [Bythopirellula polymerisocia]TWU27410.1 acyl carrier protein [Bythopirellula polymerisocia]
MDIPEEVNRILHERFEIAYDRLKPETDLYKDLELDSLDGADLLVLLEARTGQTIMPEAFLRARTLREVYGIVVGLVDSSECKSDGGGDDPVASQPAASETTVPDER